MEFLGYCEETPRINHKKQWDIVEIICPDDYSFNELTSKIFKGVKKDDCRFIVANEDNDRYFVDLLDIRFNAQERTAKIWPHKCWPAKMKK